MSKLDYKKVLKHLYQPSREPELVQVPPLRYLMIDGKGNPNHEPSYTNAVEALYAVSYTIKFMVKKGPNGLDYGVMPLEGLWWTDKMEEFSTDRKEDWHWTSMIMQPEPVTAELVQEAISQVSAKKVLPSLELVRFEILEEGPAVQIMHTGAYSEEGPTIERLHRFAADNRWSLAGKHHEIYLGDPRKTAPERLKTVIRQPVEI
jgi:hypothetical protein